jgi:hypothetical protein
VERLSHTAEEAGLDPILPFTSTHFASSTTLASISTNEVADENAGFFWCSSQLTTDFTHVTVWVRVLAPQASAQPPNPDWCQWKFSHSWSLQDLESKGFAPATHHESDTMLWSLS